MRELGDHAPGAHAKIGRRVAGYGIDVVIGVGRGGAAIASASTGGVADVRTVSNAQEAVDVLLPIAAPGDAVLIKASRALGLEVVAEALVHRENGSQHGSGGTRGHGS
jgi:UDP-N-acetylmuramoyl-tripeptide--D-alanyl-D-alanine ligase